MKVIERCSCGASVEIDWNDDKAIGHVLDWRKNHHCQQRSGYGTINKAFGFAGGGTTNEKTKA